MLSISNVNDFKNVHFIPLIGLIIMELETGEKEKEKERIENSANLKINKNFEKVNRIVPSRNWWHVRSLNIMFKTV